MKLKYAKLFNFRQYINEHQIDFGGVDDNRNVTLIRGANGYGKTGIFRAIMFCLYGDKSLAQDNLNPIQRKYGLTVVNEKLLSETPGKPVKAWVEVCFTHDGEEYTLRRNIQASLSIGSGEIAQEDGEVRLQKRTRTGITEPPVQDANEIKATISEILPYKLKDFFLFDGERMSKLTEPGDDQRKEIRKGIRTLLQLDTLDDSVKALEKQEEVLSKRIQTNSSSDLDMEIERKLKLAIDLTSEESKLAQARNEQEIVENEIKQLNNQLDEKEESIKLQEQRKQLQTEVNSKLSMQTEKITELRGVISELAPTILEHPIAELYAELMTKVERGELPGDIKKEFIDGLLQSETCICGTHLAPGTPERERLSNYQQKETIEGQDDLVKLCSKLGAIQEYAKDKQRRFDDIMVSMVSTEEEIEQLNKNIKRKEDELETCGSIDVEKLVVSLRQHEADKRGYDKQIGVLENKIIELREKFAKSNQRVTELSEKDEVAKIYDRQRKAVLAAIASLNKVKTRYTTVVRERLAELATQAFKQMASEETLESLTRILITEDFHLEVENALGRPMLSQISSGQRQIVSLAYICALIESCGNLEMPLFMDTPFGRLSGAHRDGCLNFLPTKTSQWVLLGSDTEIQEDEAIALRESKRLGKVYEIEAKGEFSSDIKECAVASWKPVRTRAKIGAIK